MNKKKIIIICSILLILLPVLMLGMMPSMVAENIDDGKYTDISMELLADRPKSSLPGNAKSFTFLEISDLDKTNQPTENLGYESNAIILEDGKSAVYEVEVLVAGKYYLILDTYTLEKSDAVPLQLHMKVNGEQYLQDENDNINLLRYYMYETKEIDISSAKDQTINAIFAPQVWECSYLYDEGIKENRLTVELEKGKNIIEITKASGRIAFGDLNIAPVEPLKAYEQYIQEYSNMKVINQTFYVQGEDFSFKNKKNINPINTQDISVTPYSMDIRFLNTIDGSTFSKHNNSIGYEIEVPEEGLYKLGFAYKSGDRKNASVFTNIYVNGVVPFTELQSFRFPYSKNYTNITTEQYVFLNKGLNTLVLEINQSNVSEQCEKIQLMYDQITETATEIRMLTGNKVDKNRSWIMEDYFPDLEQQLNDWALELAEIIKYIDKMNDNKKTEESLNLELSVTQIYKILENLDQLPNQMNLFSAGNNSVASRLTSVLGLLKNSPLFIDTIYFTEDIKSLPKIKTNFIVKVQNDTKQLLKSFSPEDIEVDENEIEVWVKRPRQNVEVMQKMIDQQFTKKTGIKVKVSLLVDQNKLTMANAAGTNPDVVTGIESYYVSDIGQRGALENIKEYPNVKQLVGAVTPGSMLQMFVEDSIYGIPETQEFYFTLYRKDIMDRLGLEVPNTWEETKNILPILQRYGMNYYIPLSAEAALKTYPATAPFIYQNRAAIFASDGFSTVIDSENGLEAFELMTELFSINGMSLQVASFYESFREGRIPIGNTRFSEYIRLYHAAPEIMGKWSIALSAGTEHDGIIDRTVTGDSTAVMMFKNSDKKAESWEFIQWWLETETQVEYLNSLQNIYGPEYIFVPANLEVIKYLPLPKEHLDIITEQISWVQEVPRIPGGYVAEREISSGFLRIVNDGKEVRSTVDDVKTTIDRELRRKMEEFGYIRDGEIVRPYTVYTIKSVESWLEDE